MKTKIYLAIVFVCVLMLDTKAQTISSSLPKPIVKSQRYLFYLHGGVVTEYGNNAITQSMPQWGPYEYLNILDSLRKHGFNVISERRQKGIADSVYVVRISKQVDSLLRAGVRPRNVTIVGASAGWDIGIRVSPRVKNDNLQFVAMGGCWPETYKSFEGLTFYGHFLSIIENTDPHGTCYRIFQNRKQIKSYREIVLHTGLSHGFIYKGYAAWIDPLVAWIAEKK